MVTLEDMSYNDCLPQTGQQAPAGSIPVQPLVGSSGHTTLAQWSPVVEPLQGPK